MTEDIPAEQQTPQQYQDARMSAIPALYRTTLERMACELALHMEEPEEIFKQYGYTPDQAAILLESPAFLALCSRIGKEVLESGLSFKTQAKVQARELLGHSYEIATDPLASTAVRADLIKWTAKMAGYEPKEGKDDGKVGGGLNLSITFAGQAPVQIVRHEPVTIEQEA
jgi:hypothetical protein